MQVQFFKKGGYLVALGTAITLSLGVVIPKTLAQRNVNTFCFSSSDSTTLTYGADASSIGSLKATVFRNGHNDKLVATVKNLGISIAVANLEETAKWYKEQLGFEEVLRKEFPEFGTRIVFIETNGITIELIEDKNWHPVNRPDPPKHTSVQGVSQITFKVDDIEAVIERVKSRPIKIAWDLVVVEDIGLKEFFIRDNEGNIIQFVETFRPVQRRW